MPLLWLAFLSAALLAALYAAVRRSPGPRLSGHIYQTTTDHARFLPVESKHRFSYKTLVVGCDLAALDNGDLDIGRWFASGKRALLSIHSSGYVYADARRSIREKLLLTLAARGVEQAPDRIYTTSMPAYLGWEGINPLVVHYCYTRASDTEALELDLVVLEVHNTFEERHLYFLKVGKDEDAMETSRFHHQWTFPRAFHVSPFNDRSGFYQVSLRDPLHSTSHPHTLISCTPEPHMHICIYLLTTESKSRKLMASLHGKGVSLSASSILSALLLYPLALLLTSPRILMQAFLLHYRKRLDVYLRPEPWSDSKYEGSNPVEAGGLEGHIMGQARHWSDRYIQKRLVERLRRAAEERLPRSSTGRAGLYLGIDLAHSNEHYIDYSGDGRRLHFDLQSPSFLVDLFLFPTLRTGLLAARADGHGTVSDVGLLATLLVSKPSTSSSLVAQQIRRARFRWLGGRTKGSSTTLFDDTPLDLLVLLYLICTDLLAFGIFKLARARFVKGTSPWEVVSRMEAIDSSR